MDEPEFDVHGILKALEQPGGWVRYVSFHEELRKWGKLVLGVDIDGGRDLTEPVKKPLLCYQRRPKREKGKKPAREKGKKPAREKGKKTVEYEESDYEEPEVFEDCSHTREEHAELQRTMGPTIKEWRKRGLAAWGDSRIFFPRFDEFVPPRKFFKGLSPREKELSLELFPRLFSCEKTLWRVCGRWSKEDSCKYQVNYDIHGLVMHEAMYLIYYEEKLNRRPTSSQFDTAFHHVCCGYLTHMAPLECWLDHFVSYLSNLVNVVNKSFLNLGFTIGRMIEIGKPALQMRMEQYTFMQ